MTKSRYFGHDFNELKREHLTIRVKKMSAGYRYTQVSKAQVTKKYGPFFIQKLALLILIIS
ncbi:MAG: hypothetical protein ACRD5J_18350 [Nitrososphaeraceae archaeon]